MTDTPDNKQILEVQLDNTKEVPNGKISEDLVKSIIGEYREWFSATKIRTATRALDGSVFCQSVAKLQHGSVNFPSASLFVDVFKPSLQSKFSSGSKQCENQDNKDQDPDHQRAAYINFGSEMSSWGGRFSTKGELRNAIENAWMKYRTWLDDPLELEIPGSVLVTTP